MNKNILLSIIFFKLGLFTFGGGYAMIPLIERDIVEKYHLISEEEMSDIILVSESTPGPLAINAATFVGYKVNKFIGAFLSTLFVVLPSFIIILIISLFFEEFLKNVYVGYAFDGIRIAVAILISEAAIKMLIKHKKNIYYYILLISAFLLSFFVSQLSSIFIILGGAVISFFVTLFRIKRGQKK